MPELKYEYPEELTSDGRNPQEEISYLAWKGAEERFPGGIPQKIIDNIHHELAFIEEMNYANYFLTVHDIVSFARSKDILCQGRGSAANSTVCYCLGITSIDPVRMGLLFERFISKERAEPPDIDLEAWRESLNYIDLTGRGHQSTGSSGEPPSWVAGMRTPGETGKSWNNCSRRDTRGSARSLRP